MKKSGKVLSLVLSLALVASSIPMAFANAATTAPAGPTVTNAGTLTYSNDVTGKLTGTNTYKMADGAANTVVATAALSAKDQYGKDYYRVATKAEGQTGTISWESSDTTVASVDLDSNTVKDLTGVATELTNKLTVNGIGQTTITAVLRNVKLYDRSSATDAGTPEQNGHYVIVPTLETKQTLYVVKNQTVTPVQPTKHGITLDGSVNSVNAVPVDTAATTMPTANLYKLTDGTNGEVVAAGNYYYTISNLTSSSPKDALCIYGKVGTAVSAAQVASNASSATVQSTEAGVAIGTFKTATAGTENFAVPFIGSFVITAYDKDPNVAGAKRIAATQVTVGKDYADASTALTIDNEPFAAVPSGFNSSFTTVNGATGADAANAIWDLTGYNVTSTTAGAVVVDKKANLSSLTALGASGITVKGDSVVSGSVTGGYIIPTGYTEDAFTATARPIDPTKKAAPDAKDTTVTIDGNHTSVGTVIGGGVMVIQGGASTGSVFGKDVTVNGTSANGTGTTVSGNVDAATKFTADTDASVTGSLKKAAGYRDDGTAVKVDDVDYAINNPAGQQFGSATIGNGAGDFTCAVIGVDVWASGEVKVQGTNSKVGGNVTTVNQPVTVTGATVGGAIDAGTGAVSATIFQDTNGAYTAPVIGRGITGGAVTVSGNNDSKATPQINGAIKSTSGAVSISGATTKDISAGNAPTNGTGAASVSIKNSTVSGNITLNDVDAGTAATAVDIEDSHVSGNVHNDAFTGAKAALKINGSTVGDVYSASPVTVSASALNSTTTVGKISSESNAVVGATTDQGNITVAALHDAIGDDLSSTEILAPVAFNVCQNGALNKVAVGDITARVAYNGNSTNKTSLAASDITATLSDLSNFSALSFDGELSNITVAKAFSTPSLTVMNGKFAAPQFATKSFTGSSAAQVALTDLTAPSKITDTFNGNLNLSIPANTAAGAKVLTYDATIDADGINAVGFEKGTAAYDAVAKTYTMTVKEATPVVLTGITLSPATSEVEVGGKATFTVNAAPAGAKLPADAKATSWTVDNTDNFTVTPAADGLSATVAAKGFSTDAAKNKGTVTVNVTADGKAYTATAAVTAKAAAPIPPKDDNFSVDGFPAVMKVGEAYQVAIKSKDGSTPTLAFGNGGSGANGAVITSKSTKGNTTYIKFTAARVGKFGLYASGTNEQVLTVKGNVCDTAKVTVKAGGTYQFKVSVRAWPTFAIAGVGTYKPTSADVMKNGNIDCFYKITFKGVKGTHNVYVNGVVASTVTVA